MNLCIYHRSDFDGIGSAALVRLAHPEIQLCGYNYGEPYPKPVTLLIAEEHNKPGSCSLVMVDITFPPPDMLVLKTLLGDRFIWVDHHVTAIADSEKHGYADVCGLRTPDFAAIQSTLSFFYKHIRCRLKEDIKINTSEAWDTLKHNVNLLGDYDSWKNGDVVRWEGEILPYQWGMRSKVKGSVDTCLSLLLENTESVLEKGRLIYAYEKDRAEMLMKGAFTIQFEGLKFLCINQSGCNSNTFNSRFNPDLWDAMLAFGYSKKANGWVVSMYTTKEGLDLTPIAKRYGGGGHKQACGFSLPDPSSIVGARIQDPDIPS